MRARRRTSLEGLARFCLCAAWLAAPGFGSLSLADPPGESAATPSKALPLPGETFLIGGRTAFVILPLAEQRKSPTPWVWYAPTLPGLPDQNEKWMFERFTAAGIAVAGIDVGESFGSPAGREGFSALYAELVQKRRFAPKACLLARSRGGLMLLGWAVEHPDQVACVAGIYPVCNLRSYPGVARASAAYGLTPAELEAQLGRHNPIDRLEPLAKAKVPIFLIHGDADGVVPLPDNSGELARRYHALGGTVRLVVPKGQGHNLWPGFFQCEELVEFILRHAAEEKTR